MSEPITEDSLFKRGFVKRWIYPENDIHPNGWFVYELGDVLTLNDDFSYSPLNVRFKLETIDRLESLYYGLTGKTL